MHARPATNRPSGPSAKYRRKLPPRLSAVSSITPQKPASARSGAKSRSGSWSAINTATSRAPSCAAGARARTIERWSPPAKKPSFTMSTPVAAIRHAASSRCAATIGRSPTVALHGHRPAIDATARRTSVIGHAPRAPCVGSLRSMMSAPNAIAATTSAGLAVLASRRTRPGAAVPIASSDCFSGACIAAGPPLHEVVRMRDQPLRRLTPADDRHGFDHAALRCPVCAIDELGPLRLRTMRSESGRRTSFPSRPACDGWGTTCGRQNRFTLCCWLTCDHVASMRETRLDGPWAKSSISTSVGLPRNSRSLHQPPLAGTGRVRTRPMLMAC